ncbi:hypothetical protein SADUNF_Sadunf10G0149700 [Salix dunnii]|uniref:Uncharacterized protein n=1 Tax=Salix dunnii TaxID=1413687 RepID=A0A835JUA4_9ROSI|nr:hypothetical protein SADUNF_Sadunf10G0149700 [Salix dunnii]
MVGFYRLHRAAVENVRMQPCPAYILLKKSLSFFVTDKPVNIVTAHAIGNVVPQTAQAGISLVATILCFGTQLLVHESLCQALNVDIFGMGNLAGKCVLALKAIFVTVFCESS